MLLAVDIGNSNTKFGIFDDKNILSKFAVPTRHGEGDDLGSVIGTKPGHEITTAIVCSVVPAADDQMRQFLVRNFKVEPHFVTHETDLGLDVRHTPRASIGMDRLVNSFSAVEQYGAPCIVCSFGTASTFDVVDRDRVLLGGVIAPGMRLMAKALHDNTAKLPEIDPGKPTGIIGVSTEDAIRSGVIYGHIAMVEGIISRLKAVVGETVQAIATGGSATFLAENTSAITVVDEDLLLDGLRGIYSRIGSA